MGTFVVNGGKSLSGTLTPQGAKNEALQVICASLLTDETVTIRNIPNILDVTNLISLLQDMGVEIGNPVNGTYTFQCKKHRSRIPEK